MPINVVPNNDPRPSTADNSPIATACKGFGAVEYTYSRPEMCVEEIKTL